MRLTTVPRLLLLTFCTVPLAGCSMFAGNRDAQSPPPGAVQAYQVTHLPNPDAHFTLAYPTGDRRTSALLLEQVTPGEVRLDRECAYQIKITNLTGNPIRGILLRSRPLDGMRVTASSATTRPIGDGQLVYDVGDLGPHEYTTVDVRAIPDRLGTVDAAYVVSITPPVLRTSLNVVQPVLALAASGPADVDLCQEIVYRYTVTNTGTGTARDVLVQAALPDGLTTADGRPVISAPLGDIPQGASRDVTARLRASRTGRFSSTAVAHSRGDDAVRAQPLVTAAHAPDLALAVQGPSQVYAGKPAVYSVTVTNTGDAPARQATLRLSPSDIGQLVSVRTDTDAGPGEPQLASAAVDLSSNNLGTLRPGESRHLEITTNATDGGTLALDAVASAPCAKDAKQTTRTRVLTVPALRIAVADDPDPAPLGQYVTYTVTVTNAGTGTDTRIRLTATLPESLAFVHATGPTEARADGRTVTFYPVARMSPHETATWRITTRALRAGDAQLKLSATSDALKTPQTQTEPTRLY